MKHLTTNLPKMKGDNNQTGYSPTEGKQKSQNRNKSDKGESTTTPLRRSKRNIKAPKRLDL